MKFNILIYNRLYSFLSNHECIYINQFGFRKYHSTIHALISLTEHIPDSLDKNKIACGIFIDLQKAFHIVDHELLLDKLAYYGTRCSSMIGSNPVLVIDNNMYK